MHIMKKAFIVWVALGLAGCIGPYREPQLPPEQAATITGSDIQAAVPLHARISWIGKSTAFDTGKTSWVIAPGPQDIKVSVGASPPPLSGSQYEFKFIAEPQQKYAAKAGDFAFLTSTCAKATVWIENADGKLVTEKITAFLTANSGPGYETMSGGVLLHFYPPAPPPCPPVPAPPK